ncbi:MAG: hypothetical protein WCV93_05650 [Candidatus Shapirobacteria bacterium]|jgi:hypothetical protein
MKWGLKSAFNAVILAVTALVAPTGAMAVDVFCTPKNFPAPGINTALGCIPVRMTHFVGWLMPYLFGVAGGIAFLKMVSGFISIATSNGDAKAVAAAQEEITAAIVGLLVVIFALFILKLIGDDILKIPGFS